MTAIRVLVVDDQDLIRDGIAMILESQDDLRVVGQAGDGRQAVDAVRSTGVDVVLMDVRMPVLDGISATEQITALPDPPRVLVLTTFDDDAALAGALRAGAAGFLLKGVPAEDLQRAVRAVATGDGWLDPAVTGRVLSTYRTGAPEPDPAPDTTGLTPREQEVLALIGAGLSNTEIAERLFLGEGTVKTHVGHIFTKLDVRDRAAAVVYAFDHGLVRPRRR